MLDFYNNTYFVKRTEKDAVIEILKRHPEYRGYNGDAMINSYGFEQDKYDSLWKLINEYFDEYEESNVIFLDNGYITMSMIQQHPWLIELSDVYINENCVKHDPQSLLPQLIQIDRPLMKVE